MSKLFNYCDYSFKNLIDKSNYDITIKELYDMSHDDRNEKVKELCNKASWFWEEQLGKDGNKYIAFSPKLNNSY